jgi:hypothetical protein
MNKQEAIQILETELVSFRKETYADLVRRLVGQPIDYERNAASGVKYQVNIQVFWDDRPGGNVRVMGSIDDGGWRALLPLCRSFIKSADDSFVGE